jgi:hypothetical protein
MKLERGLSEESEVTSGGSRDRGEEREEREEREGSPEDREEREESGGREEWFERGVCVCVEKESFALSTSRAAKLTASTT